MSIYIYIYIYIYVYNVCREQPQIVMSLATLAASAMASPGLRLSQCKRVKNNFTLHQKSMLLTGSNMSGKTTFIRTVSANSILAQTLNICFATSFSTPFYKVYSSIRITDDLLDNTSYYLQEVLRIKELIKVFLSLRSSVSSFFIMIYSSFIF